MKSRPEIDKAPAASTVGALSEESQTATKGTFMPNSKALTVAGTSVRQMNGLYSLNDLHKASGAEAKHQPGYFMRRDETQALIAEICSADSQIKALEYSEESRSSTNSAKSQSYQTKEGRGGGTYACKELVIAYAAWISAAFHLKVIRVFLAVAAPAVHPAIDPDRIALAEALAAEAITRVYHAVFSAVMAGGEWWKHDRYLLSLRYDHHNKPTIPIARPFASGEMMVSMDKLPDMINGPDPVSCNDLQLARLAVACAQRQEFRAERRAERERSQQQIAQHALSTATKAIGVAV